MYCRLIVCEKTSHWAAALRAEYSSGQPAVVETRSLAACEAALAKSPASLVSIEVTPANLETAASFVSRLGSRFPAAVAVALLGPDMQAAAMLLREAGAIETIASVLELPRVVRLAERQLARAPQSELSLRELVAERMPWPAQATSQT